MPNLVKYSSINKKYNMNFLKKKYIKNDYTIFYDVGVSSDAINRALLSDIKNLVIDDKSYSDVNVTDIKAKNIYFSNNENLGGITIPFELINKSSRSFKFTWSEKGLSNIDKINIKVNNKVRTIDVGDLKFVRFYKGLSDKIRIAIEDDKTFKVYNVDKLGNISTEKRKYIITKDDIKDNTLDLSDYINYEEIHANMLKVKDLILDNKCVKYLYKLYDVLLNIKYSRLIIIDNNEMKLMPNKTILSNKNIGDIEIYQSSDNLFYILYKKEKLIYSNNKEIKVIDKNKLIKDDILVVNIYIEENQFKQDPIIIIKYKNNKSKIYNFNEEFNIDKNFNKFNILNIDKYYLVSNELKELLNNNDWYKMFYEDFITFKKFNHIYGDYLIYIRRYNELMKKGFTDKAIKYLYENHFDNIVDKNYKYKYNINEMSEEEIEKFNELGSIYVKKKVLK